MPIMIMIEPANIAAPMADALGARCSDIVKTPFGRPTLHIRPSREGAGDDARNTADRVPAGGCAPDGRRLRGRLCGLGLEMATPAQEQAVYSGRADDRPVG